MTETARSTLLSGAANAALMFPVLSSAQIARIASHGDSGPNVRSVHYFSGTNIGAPLSFTKNATNFAGFVWLAFRPTA